MFSDVKSSNNQIEMKQYFFFFELPQLFRGTKKVVWIMRGSNYSEFTVFDQKGRKCGIMPFWSTKQKVKRAGYRTSV